MLWHPECNTNNMYITNEQDLIISYCRADKDAVSCEGSINVSHILTCVLTPPQPTRDAGTFATPATPVGVGFHQRWRAAGRRRLREDGG